MSHETIYRSLYVQARGVLNWTLFREIEKRWAAVKKTSHRRKAEWKLSLLPVSTECHTAGDQGVTQTNPTNHSNLTSGPSIPAVHNATPGQSPSPKGQPRKPARQRPFSTASLQVFSAPRTTARAAAEKRWSKDLHDHLVKFPDRYAEIIEAIEASCRRRQPTRRWGRAGLVWRTSLRSSGGGSSSHDQSLRQQQLLFCFWPGKRTLAACGAEPLAYGIPQVCRLTGLGRTTIYGAIKSGHLTARRYGRRTVVLEHDLLRFLNNLPEITSAETALA